jgi:hypothetical protein
MRVAAFGLLFLCGVVFGCQDYPFVEVQGASVTERQEVFEAVVGPADILFVIDNSGSMAGEQQQLARSFADFIEEFDSRVGPDQYRIAVITTGMSSPGCRSCEEVPSGCILGSAGGSREDGRFQERLGSLTWEAGAPVFSFAEDQDLGMDCRVVTSRNTGCFFDPATQRGTALVGVTGCGYERPLAAIRAALDPAFTGAGGPNRDFLRPEATLAVILVSDEEDCGEPGELPDETSGNSCYYAALGQTPAGGAYPTLTEVAELKDRLLGLKQGDSARVRFAAIVGVDPAGSQATAIRFDAAGKPLPACVTADCPDNQCDAFPSTRAIALAESLGSSGWLASICQADFSETLREIAAFISCPGYFDLKQPLLDPSVMVVLLNDELIPNFSCDRSGALAECESPGDPICGADACVSTWTYQPPETLPAPAPTGGRITFAPHFDPCKQVTGGRIRLEVRYAVDP